MSPSSLPVAGSCCREGRAVLLWAAVLLCAAVFERAAGAGAVLARAAPVFARAAGACEEVVPLVATGRDVSALDAAGAVVVAAREVVDAPAVDDAFGAVVVAADDGAADDDGAD